MMIVLALNPEEVEDIARTQRPSEKTLLFGKTKYRKVNDTWRVRRKEGKGKS